MYGLMFQNEASVFVKKKSFKNLQSKRGFHMSTSHATFVLMLIYVKSRGHRYNVILCR
jgi:hypothetical protein